MRAKNNVQQNLDHNNLYFISDKLYSAVDIYKTLSTLILNML